MYRLALLLLCLAGVTVFACGGNVVVDGASNSTGTATTGGGTDTSSDVGFGGGVVGTETEIGGGGDVGFGGGVVGTETEIDTETFTGGCLQCACDTTEFSGLCFEPCSDGVLPDTDMIETDTGASFCAGGPATEECAACIATMCGSTPAACN
jgi:hypothetical protein